MRSRVAEEGGINRLHGRWGRLEWSAERHGGGEVLVGAWSEAARRRWELLCGWARGGGELLRWSGEMSCARCMGCGGGQGARRGERQLRDTERRRVRPSLRMLVGVGGFRKGGRLREREQATVDEESALGGHGLGPDSQDRLVGDAAAPELGLRLVLEVGGLLLGVCEGHGWRGVREMGDGRWESGMSRRSRLMQWRVMHDVCGLGEWTVKSAHGLVAPQPSMLG
jgi:hypothetical protein